MTINMLRPPRVWVSTTCTPPNRRMNLPDSAVDRIGRFVTKERSGNWLLRRTRLYAVPVGWRFLLRRPFRKMNWPVPMKTPDLYRPTARILVINVARIGDTILAVPVLRALRAPIPRAEIVCLAHPKRVEVLEGLPQIDRCAAISKRSAPFMGWLGKAYDLALVFGHEPALLAYALRAARHVLRCRR